MALTYLLTKLPGSDAKWVVLSCVYRVVRMWERHKPVRHSYHA